MALLILGCFMGSVLESGEGPDSLYIFALESPVNPYTFVNGMNNSGQIVGFDSNELGYKNVQSAIVWSAATGTILGGGIAAAINDAGTVAGTYGSTPVLGTAFSKRHLRASVLATQASPLLLTPAIRS